MPGQACPYFAHTYDLPPCGNVNYHVRYCSHQAKYEAAEYELPLGLCALHCSACLVYVPQPSDAVHWPAPMQILQKYPVISEGEPCTGSKLCCVGANLVKAQMLGRKTMCSHNTAGYWPEGHALLKVEVTELVVDCSADLFNCSCPRLIAYAGFVPVCTGGDNTHDNVWPGCCMAGQCHS